MDKLPNVYANPIDKKIDNVQELYNTKEERTYKSPVDVNKKINNIFADKNHVYKSKVRITLKDKEVIEEIVGKTNMNLLTMNGKTIKIIDIIDIDKI